MIEQRCGVCIAQSPKTTEKDVVEATHEQTGPTLKVEKLRSKYNTLLVILHSLFI